MKNLSIYYFLMAFALLFTACTKTDETVDPSPSVTVPSVSGGAVTSATVGQTITFNVSVVAQASIKSIETRLGTVTLGTIKTSGFTNSTSDTYPFTYTVTSADAGKTLEFAFVVTDKKERVSSTSYSVAVASQISFNANATASGMTLLSNVASNPVANSGSFYSSSTKTSATSGAAVASTVDITYGIVGTTPSFVSPDARVANNLGIGTPALTGLTRTTFGTTTLSFDTATAAQVAAAADPTATVQAIMANSTYIFKNAAGKKGLIRVTSLTNVASASGGTTQNAVFDIKVLQ